MSRQQHLFFVVCAFMSAAGAAQSPHDVDLHSQAAVDAATLRITINPESRVSVKRTGDLPAPAPCGTPLAIPVSIVNHGFFTGSLEATWAGSPVAGGSLSWATLPMNGAPREARVLHVTLAQSGPVDVTIAFKARGDRPDLDGRDRVNLLLTCIDRTPNNAPRIANER